MLTMEEIEKRLIDVGYIPSKKIVTAVFLALNLEKPLLIEGPAGCGKTSLGIALSKMLGYPLIRLQCYEGILVEQTIYEWNYHKQILRIQIDSARGSLDDTEASIFSEEFLLERPLLKALRSEKAVLLIDEIDKADEAFEAFLLEFLGERQITIPELGTIRAPEGQKLYTVITSNNSRELSEPLRRRCIYLYLDFPPMELEKRIIKAHCPGIEEKVLEKIVLFVNRLRSMKLQKVPSISEAIDFAKSVMAMNITDLDPRIVEDLLTTLLKVQNDIDMVLDYGLEKLLQGDSSGKW